MATTLAEIPSDIIQSEILPRLDGCELATISCVSSTLRSISRSHELWSQICTYTWPSTKTPRLQGVISSFPNGPLSFFSLAFPLLHPCSNLNRPSSHPPPETLISAVDLFYKGNPVLSKTQETDTLCTDWFRSAPFRIDLLDIKEMVPTPIPAMALDDDTCQDDLYRDLELSWILIDPIGRRAVNVSSMNPVSVHRHWLTGELQARFASVMDEEVVCVVEVTWASVDEEEEKEGGTSSLKVREVGLEIEDLEGIRVSGKQSMEIVERGLECGRRVLHRTGDDSEGKSRRRNYDEFMERRRERKERRNKDDAFWEMIYVAIALLLFALFCSRFFWSISNAATLNDVVSSSCT